MNKVLDERIVPNGEYIDALNIRMGSTENAEIGVIENTKGNEKLSNILYVDGTPISTDARCIGAFADSLNEKVYWFIHDPSFTVGATGKLDLIVSYDTNASILTYHIISVDDGGGTNTTLNFNNRYLITGVNKIDDLIFFTDDYNQPRFINVNRVYLPPSANIDQFSNESILVVKKPPVESPSILPTTVAGQENFLEENFICFAYRYRYADGEYSATSQWSEPSFVPKPFGFERDSFLNSGMVNSTNACQITYNSGGPLVVGVDLLFKSADSNVIKVIEKINKADAGLANNTNYTYIFSNSKIYTILPESELLRLYDNVPLLAKAQTLMGNRLMYGNYVDGYDLVDKNGENVKFEYEAELIEEKIGTENVDDSSSVGVYSIDTSTSVSNSVLNIDFNDVVTGTGLVSGAYITIDVTLEHATFTTSPFPSETTDPFTISFFYQLPTDFATLAAMVSDPSFQDSIGTPSNIQPVSNAQNGTTFTDTFNSNIPATLSLSPSGSYSKYKSGITAVDEPILATTSGNTLFLQFPAMQFVDNTTTPTAWSFEYYKVVSASVEYQPTGVGKSLHSNRDYDVGIVYMDEFNRSTTALVSPDNTVYVPCGNSAVKNSIQVTIPPTQIAPSWATRYKFVIKPNAEGYETIYSNIFYTETGTNYVWFLLEGENSKKVEIGDRYIVKADTNGPMETCAYATVLDKDIKTPSGGYPNGVYMKMLPTDFNTSLPLNATYSVYDSEQCSYSGCQYPEINLNVSGQDVPSGSKISLYFYWRRRGNSNTGACEQRSQEYRADFISSADYPDFKSWWDGDNVDTTLNNSLYRTCFNPFACSSNVYLSSIGVPTPELTVNYFQFTSLGNLRVTGTKACSGGATSNRVSFLEGRITIVRTVNTLVFETLPLDSNPDIYYENDLSFSINALGEHQGNVQNQVFSTNTPAIVDTGFFNCYAFGNGVESYKVRDSLIGHSFNLGNRVTSVSAQDYKRADRYADITYSGIYNNETNVNKLNEFNLGLLNYKPLENSFGGIYILDGRETDVLVLQEDKISYVLAGKNLLSDSAAGGAITSVPEVLGTQIARVEKYGITFNPESYVQWGYDRFFTDSKRGAVIRLRGGSSQSDQLQVISEQGMRTWFRDEFIDTFNKQKLGGFDPYMNEYVLSVNDRDIIDRDDDGCIDCGTTQTFVLFGEEESNVLEYCVELGSQTGLTTLTWTVLSGTTGPSDGFDISVTYDGNTITSGFTTTSGTLSFDKDSITEALAQVSVSMTGNFTISMSMSCPLPQEMTIIEVVLTDNSEALQTTYAQYRYVSGSYTSPLQSRFVTFASGTSNPLVSWYNSVSGVVGTGGFPPAGSTMRMYNNKIAPTATFNFNPVEDKFRYHRSNTLYNNSSVDMNALLGVSTIATPIFGTSPINYADFTVPTTGTYLYLIWDYRTTVPNGLCYGTSSDEVCCNCETCELGACITVTISNPSEQFNAAVTFNGGSCDNPIPMSVELDPAETVTMCVINTVPLYTVVLGNPIVSTALCQCSEEPCFWILEAETLVYPPFYPTVPSYYQYINQIVPEGWKGGFPTYDSTFAGCTIDGLDFTLNYASVISLYGANASQIVKIRNFASTGGGYSNYTSEGVIVTYIGFTPPSYIGEIKDEYGRVIPYRWKQVTCEWGCVDVPYSISNPTPVVNDINFITFLFSELVGSIDVVSTFGSAIDLTNPSSVSLLESFLRTMIGNQHSLTSVYNPSSMAYDLVVNNAPIGFYRFVYTPTIPSGSTVYYWQGSTTTACISDCTPDTIDFDGLAYDGTPFTPIYTYVTQQVSGVNMPVTFRVEWDQATYQGPCFYIYYRIDTVAPSFTSTIDPMSQGFTLMTPDFTNTYTLPPINAGEYLSLAVDGPTNACGFPPVINVPITIRNETAQCYGELINYITANIKYS